MNNEALVIVDAPHEDIEKILAFIQTKTKGLKGEEHEILDSFPILYVRNEDHQICKELTPYIAEELIFDNGTNQAEQSYEEIIELLDTTDVYLYGGSSVDIVNKKIQAIGVTTHRL